MHTSRSKMKLFFFLVFPFPTSLELTAAEDSTSLCIPAREAVHCKDGCSALQEGLQCTASEMGKSDTEIANPILDKRRGRKNESL